MIEEWEDHMIFSRIKMNDKNRRIYDGSIYRKMLGQALRQYGRNVSTDPLSPYEKQSLKKL